jgi:ABC-type branched-subunit amino acid transport system substrate-binding protein
MALTGYIVSTVAEDISLLAQVCGVRARAITCLCVQGYCMPVVSSSSTASELDNVNIYPYFMRTCASDIYHADTIVQLLRQQNFRRLTVFYESDTFGIGMKTQFELKLEEYDNEYVLLFFKCQVS